MFTNFNVYYPDYQCRIMPFIVSHVNQYQDTLILAPENLPKKQEQFISTIYSQISSEILQSFYSRAFLYESYLCVIIAFPSNIKDEGDRKGLLFTIGCLICKDVLNEYEDVCRTYINLMIKIIGKIFDVNLFENGADSILQQFQNEENYDHLREKLELIKDLILCFNPIKSKSKRLSFNIFLPRTFRKRLIPKVIFYQMNQVDSDLIDFFLCELDYIIQESSHKKLNIACANLLGKDIITLIPVSLIPTNINEARVKNTENKKYICLY